MKGTNCVVVCPFLFVAYIFSKYLLKLSLENISYSPEMYLTTYSPLLGIRGEFSSTLRNLITSLMLVPLYWIAWIVSGIFL